MITNLTSLLDFRHANSLLRKAKEGDLEAVNAIFGTFACQASNLAGVGEKCSISIDGPPSALVADTDTTYLIFGGGSVLLFIFIIVSAIILCRKHTVNKYETGISRMPPSNGQPRLPNLAENTSNASRTDLNGTTGVTQRTNAVPDVQNHLAKNHSSVVLATTPQQQPRSD